MFDDSIRADIGDNSMAITPIHGNNLNGSRASAMYSVDRSTTDVDVELQRDGTGIDERNTTSFSTMATSSSPSVNNNNRANTNISTPALKQSSGLSSTQTVVDINNNNNNNNNMHAPTLSAKTVADGYYTSPTVEQLSKLSTQCISSVKNFKIGKKYASSIYCVMCIYIIR